MERLKDLKIKLFADGAHIEEMKKVYAQGIVSGFTTNPYFLKLSGVKDYEAFSKAAVEAIPDLPLSFEVISDDFESMEKEARKTASWGQNVFVKIPVTNCKGESSAPLIKKLSNEGMKLNITAIYTLEQVKMVVDALSTETESYISVFAGRIGETGVDPEPIMKLSAEIIDSRLPNTALLWASTREVYNIFQAEKCGCKIITVANDILSKLGSVGTPLEQASLDTVRYFHQCAQLAGYKII